MSWDKIYSVANDTLNGAVVEDVLMDKVDESIITTPIVSIGITGDALTYTFKSEPTAGEITVLDLITNNHDGVPYSEAPESVEISKEPSFTSKKILVNGVEKSLFKRVHGVKKIIAGNTAEDIDFVVPHTIVKFTGAEIFGCELGDSLNFTVHDNEYNSYSGAPLTPAPTYYPNFQLNQFGYNVNMPPNGEYQNTSNYYADLYVGMIIRCTYTNNSFYSKTIYMNPLLHEVK